MEERKQVTFPTPKHAPFGCRVPSKGIFNPHILPSDSWKSAREKRQFLFFYFLIFFCDSHLETVLFCNSTLHPSGQSKSAWYWERKGLLCGSKPSYSQLILELIFFFFSSSWEEGQRVNSNVSIGSTGSWPYYMCCWGWLPWWAKEDGGFQNIVGWGVGGKRVWREQVLLMPGTCTFGGLLDRGGWEKSAGGCRLQDLGKERGQLRAWLLQLCNVICFYLCGLPVVMFELLLQLKLWFPWVCSLGSPAIENFCLKNPPADGWDSSVPSSVCNELDK